MSRVAMLCASLSAWLVLAACGGGGGGGESSTPSTSGGDGSATTITSTNVDRVGGAAIVGAEASATSVTLPSAQIAGVETTTGENSLPGVGALAIKALQIAEAHRESASANLPVGVTINETVPCATSGNMAVSYSNANAHAELPGDTLTVTFNSCVDSGLTMNGTIGLAVTTGGNPATAFNVSFSSFTAANSSSTMQVSGSLSMVVTGSSYQLTSPSLSVAMTGSVGNGSVSIKNLNGIVTKSGTNYIVSLNESIDVSVGVLSAVGTIATITPLTIDNTSTIVAGKLLVTGSHSSVWLTFQGSGNVLLELDSNGDGVVDLNKNTTIATLKNAS